MESSLYIEINNINNEKDGEEYDLNIDISEINSNIDDATKMYFKDISKIKPLEKEEEKTLLEEYKNGNKKAKEKLVNNYLRAVILIAKKYTGRGIDLIDLIQEGNLCLINEIDNYVKDDNSCALSSYINKQLKRTMEEAIIKKSRLIPISANAYKNINRLKKIEEILVQEFGRCPTYAELSESSDISVENVIKIKQYEKDIVSLDILVDNENNTTLLDCIPSSDIPVEKKALILAIMEEINDKMDENFPINTEDESKNKYNIIKRKIIKKRLGLFEEGPKPLDEIAEELGISIQSASQFELGSLRKIMYGGKYHLN